MRDRSESVGAADSIALLSDPCRGNAVPVTASVPIPVDEAG